MSENLINAVYAYFIVPPANDFFTATKGRMSYGVARDDWKDNFATMQMVSISQDDLFRQTLDDLYFQINLFSSSRTNCWDILTKCKALYDRTSLTVTGQYPVFLRRENQIPPLWDEQDNLWQATIEFSCKIQPT